MTTPASTVQVQFAHPWTNPSGGASYTVGQLATLDLELAKRLVFNAIARYTVGNEPAVPPGLVDDVELGQVLATYEKKVDRAGASPGFVVQLDADGQSLELGPPPTPAGGQAFIGGATKATAGLLKLAGDLSGTADLPTVPGLAGRLTLEQMQDAVAAMLVAGPNISIAYNDELGTLTIESAGSGGPGGSTDPELVRDTIAAALVAGTNMTVTVSDDANTITLAAAPTDPEVVRDAIGAALRPGAGINLYVDDVANTITIGVAAGAPGGGLTAEDVQDVVAAFIVPGNGLTSTYDDATGALTLTVSGGAAGTTDPEVVRDVIGQALLGSSNVQVAVDDTRNTITVSTAATVNQPDDFLLDRTNHVGVPTLPNWQANTPYPANAIVLRSGVMQVAKTALVATGSFDQASWFAQSGAQELVTAPPKVTGLIVGTRTSATIELLWGAALRATGYRVEYRVAGTPTWTATAEVAGTSRTIVNLAPSTSYQVQVVALNSAGPGPMSDPIATTTTATSEAAPDFTVSNVRWSPLNPEVGQPVTFSADVTNGGGALPGGTVIGVRFAVNGTNVSWSDNFTGAVASGQTISLTANGGPSGLATWVAGAIGTYNVTAVADDAGRFAEANELNNSASATLSVVAAGTGGLPFTAAWAGAADTAWPSPWVITPAGGSGVTVNGTGKGLIRPPDANFERRAVKHNGLSVANVEVRGKLAFSPRPGRFHANIHVRATGWTGDAPTTSYSLFMFSDGTNGDAISASIRKVAPGFNDDLVAGGAGRVLIPNTVGYSGDISYRFYAVEGVLKAKVWRSDTTEPTAYNVTAPVQTQPLPAGTVGVHFLRLDSAGITNLTATLSEFVVTTASTAGQQTGVLPWKSGASGDVTATGEFEAWRERPVTITGSWIDNNDSMLWQGNLTGSGVGDYGSWVRDIDVGFGAFGNSWNGDVPVESWKAASEGAYDGRWTEGLQKLRQNLHGRIGPDGTVSKVYIRFAHEWNANFYPWGISSGEKSHILADAGSGRPASTKEHFKAAWVRFRALQRTHFPEALVVCNTNHEQTGGLAEAWETWMPAADTFDVYSVDYYDIWYGVFKESEWDYRINTIKGAYDSIKALNNHRLLAQSLGKPIAVSEWGEAANRSGTTMVNGVEYGLNPYPQPAKADFDGTPAASMPDNVGDSPVYVSKMYQWFAQHAGTGPGQLLYEIYFNVDRDFLGNFHLFTNHPLRPTRLPRAAAQYRAIWSGRREATNIPTPSEPLDGSGSTPVAPPPSSGSPTIQDTDAGTTTGKMNLVGGWSQYLDMHYSTGLTSYADIFFSGTGLQVWGSKDPAYGIAGARIDGGTEVMVDLYGPTPTSGTNMVKLYEATGLTDGPHVLRWRKTGTKNAAATFADISIDRAVVTVGAIAPPATPVTLTVNSTDVSGVTDGSGQVIFNVTASAAVTYEVAVAAIRKAPGDVIDYSDAANYDAIMSSASFAAGAGNYSSQVTPKALPAGRYATWLAVRSGANTWTDHPPVFFTVTPPGTGASAATRSTLVAGSYTPDATTTGRPSDSPALTVHTGSYTLTTAGQTFTDVQFDDQVIVQAANVTFVRCLFRGTAAAGTASNAFLLKLDHASQSNTVVDDSTFLPQLPSRFTEGIRGKSFTARRNRFTNCVDFVAIVGSGVTLHGNWGSDFAYYTPDANHSDNQSHNDAVQFHPGTSGTVLKGNRWTAKYGNAGSHQPSHRTGPSPSGATWPSAACYMFGSNLAAGAVLSIDSQDEVFEGGWQPVNAGMGGKTVTIGKIWRGRFDGDSYLGPNMTGTSHTISTNSTVTTTHLDAGEGTANKNVYTDGTAVNVRRNQ